MNTTTRLTLTEAFIEPNGFDRRFEQLEPGLFAFGTEICFMSEYGDAFIVDSGEAFWGGTSSAEARAKLIVKPLRAVVRALEGE